MEINGDGCHRMYIGWRFEGNIFRIYGKMEKALWMDGRVYDTRDDPFVCIFYGTRWIIYSRKVFSDLRFRFYGITFSHSSATIQVSKTSLLIRFSIDRE
jgi:hypothetical protein